MPDTIWTEADLAALDAQIATVGVVKATTIGDQSTTFRDLKEMLALRAIMAAALATSTGTSRTRYAATSKGIA